MSISNWFHKFGQDEVISPEDFSRIPLNHRDKFGPTPAGVTKKNARYGLNEAGQYVLIQHGELNADQQAQEQQFQRPPIDWMKLRQMEEERLKKAAQQQPSEIKEREEYPSASPLADLAIDLVEAVASAGDISQETPAFEGFGGGSGGGGGAEGDFTPDTTTTDDGPTYDSSSDNNDSNDQG